MTFESPDIRTLPDVEEASIRTRLNEALAHVEALLSEREALRRELLAWRKNAANHVAGLSPRQRQVMDMVLAGHASKMIAWKLGISQRTVENHRASIMKRTGTRCVAALARLALAEVPVSDVDDRAGALPHLSSPPNGVIHATK
jgi:two-component system CheB/CheR fusion protein